VGIQAGQSIHTRQAFAARARLLKELDSFLEKRSGTADRATYEANASISVIPLNLGVMKQGSERLYAAMTASGLISIWGRNKDGEFTLDGVSEGEYQ
jgi:hypothetical protein